MFLRNPSFHLEELSCARENLLRNAEIEEQKFRSVKKSGIGCTEGGSSAFVHNVVLFITVHTV
jgi:hypothetical protein